MQDDIWEVEGPSFIMRIRQEGPDLFNELIANASITWEPKAMWSHIQPKPYHPTMASLEFDGAMAAERRERCYRLPTPMMNMLLREEHAFRVMRGIPLDATVMSVHINYLRNAIDVLVAHPSWDAIPINEEAPVHLVSIEDVTALLEHESGG